MRRQAVLHFASVLLLAAWPALASEAPKTVIGPENIFLYDGANALMARDGEEGVRLTLLGLNTAKNAREKKIAHSNLCAGFLLINEPEKALTHCNWVIDKDERHWRTYNNRALVLMRLERFDEAEEDIRKGEAHQDECTIIIGTPVSFIFVDHPVAMCQRSLRFVDQQKTRAEVGVRYFFLASVLRRVQAKQGEANAFFAVARHERVRAVVKVYILRPDYGFRRLTRQRRPRGQQQDGRKMKDCLAPHSIFS